MIQWSSVFSSFWFLCANCIQVIAKFLNNEQFLFSFIEIMVKRRHSCSECQYAKQGSYYFLSLKKILIGKLCDFLLLYIQLSNFFIIIDYKKQFTRVLHQIIKTIIRKQFCQKFNSQQKGILQLLSFSLLLLSLIIFRVQHMYNKEFLKYERLKNQLDAIKSLCADQYFAVTKCPGGQVPNTQCKSGKAHVERCYYPCIHFYMGNCKYGFNCLFSHSIKRQIVKPEPPKEVCRKLYYENYCPQGNKCRFSHDLRTQPCIYNSLGKCKFSADTCRFSHQKKVDVSVPCFFNLMGGCKNEQCENKHSLENIIKYISYEGPI